MDYEALAKIIIGLKDEDLQLRQKLVENQELFQTYHSEMEAMHKRNTQLLDQIINTIGYPSIEKVGEEAHSAAWMIMQHSISQPMFMKKCAQLLEVAARENPTYQKYLAYLKDRIAVLQGEPQLYGTQFDWDTEGHLSPSRMDDVDKVNARRAAIGLNSIEEQTELIRAQAQAEGAAAPVDAAKRKQEYEAWKDRVGW